MLLYMYQIFSSLLGHLPFLVHFLLHFNGVTFFGTPNTNNIVDSNQIENFNQIISNSLINLYQASHSTAHHI